MKTFKCDCGFEWDEGNSGHHICSRFYMEKVDKLQQENKALMASIPKIKADAVRGLLDAESWDSRIDGESYFKGSSIAEYADELEGIN